MPPNVPKLDSSGVLQMHLERVFRSNSCRLVLVSAREQRAGVVRFSMGIVLHLDAHVIAEHLRRKRHPIPSGAAEDREGTQYTGS